MDPSWAGQEPPTTIPDSQQGLAPRVSPRTPATTPNETLSDSIAEDPMNNPTTIDDILFSTDPDRPQSPRLSPPLFTPVNERMETEETTSTTTTTSITTATKGEKLLSLEKTKAHLDYAIACQAERQIPKGLRINVRCCALMANLTDVQTQFDRNTNRAQENYVGHLRAHYEALAEQLGQKRSLVTSTMDTLLTQATPQEKHAHQEMTYQAWH